MEIHLKKPTPLASTFVMRRFHSLFGLWLVLYLCEHLWVNMHALLLPWDQGSHFVALVNKIQHLPYLRLIEVLLLALPFAVHMIWGVCYLCTAKSNAHLTEGTKPMLPQYPRNRAYSWQRWTSWLLLVGVSAHVMHMRFLEAPAEMQGQYVMRLTQTSSLKKIAERLNVNLQSEAPKGQVKPLAAQEVYALAPSAGAAFLLLVYKSFSSPLIVVLYLLFVLAALYHGFNGFWTFLLTWGIVISHRSQTRARLLSRLCMTLLMIIGLSTVLGTYLLVHWQYS